VSKHDNKIGAFEPRFRLFLIDIESDNWNVDLNNCRIPHAHGPWGS